MMRECSRSGMGRGTTRRRCERTERSRACTTQSHGEPQNIRSICLQFRRNGLVMLLWLCESLRGQVLGVLDRLRLVVHFSCADVIKAYGVRFQESSENAPQPFNLKSSTSALQSVHDQQVRLVSVNANNSTADGIQQTRQLRKRWPCCTQQPIDSVLRIDHKQWKEARYVKPKQIAALLAV